LRNGRAEFKGKDAKNAPQLERELCCNEHADLLAAIPGRTTSAKSRVALLPAPARQSVPQLSDQEKATRLDCVKTALGASDPTVPIGALAADSNVLLIIEKRLCYDDV